MKPGTVVFCVFVKKLRFPHPQDSLQVLHDLETVNYLPRLKQDINECDRIPLSLEIAVAVGFLLITLVAFSLMEGNPAYNLLIQSRLSNKRLSQGQDTPTPSRKSLKAHDKNLPKVIKPANGNFRFRKGFLRKSNSNSSLNRLPDFVDVSKPAEAINQGNISVVYKLFDSDSKPSAIFKPFDNVNDDKENLTPKKNSESSLVLSPRSHCDNEVLAYKFDQSINAGVPLTQLAAVPKNLFGSSNLVNGSLQKFVVGESCEDFGSNLFSTEDVHKIGVLDLLILNCDRHSGNMLFNPESKKLTPIDHALSFPSLEFTEGSESPAVLSRSDFTSELYLKHVNYDWAFFPQTTEPFSPEILNSIEKISIPSLLAEMTRKGLSNSKKLAVFSSATLLKVAALRYRKTLREIAEIVQRSGAREEKSVLEHLIVEVSRNLNINKLMTGDAAETAAFCANFETALEDFFKL